MGDMHGLRSFNLLSNIEFKLQLTSTTTSPLAIDIFETTHSRIQRLINENPVIIFSSSTCYMCDVMKRLFYSIGVYPTVIELGDDEVADVAVFSDGEVVAPVVFIGGSCIGGLENLVAQHLSGGLASRLIEIGALMSS